jgi:hypothetical protein
MKLSELQEYHNRTIIDIRDEANNSELVWVYCSSMEDFNIYKKEEINSSYNVTLCKDTQFFKAGHNLKVTIVNCAMKPIFRM